MDEPRIKYNYPVFPDQTEPHGQLSANLECQACWYYYVLAHKVWARVGKSIEDQFGTLEGDPWLSKDYQQIARSVAAVYGLKDPSEFMKYWPMVTAEAIRQDMTPPQEEYMKPLRFVVN